MQNIHKIIFETLPIGIIVTDSKLKVLNYNESAALFFPKTSSSTFRLSTINFYTHNQKRFDLIKCLNALKKRETEKISKILIVKNNEIDAPLVYLTAVNFSTSTQTGYIITLSNVSKETECLSSPSLSTKRAGVNTIIGQHESIRELQRLITLAADANVSVLITGESGTGKELVADAIHNLSERKNKAFVKVNCSALTETLLESELFGHVKGSFTGAYKDKIGKFEEANGGTLFLDEIGEISPALQVKLLRVLQTKIIERVGDNKSIKLDIRIIAATNKDLREQISQNLFREDFFYRLNVFPIKTPPLREHKNDIPLICEHLIDKFNFSFQKQIKGISPNAYRLLMDYCWPGNVRELENAIEHSFVLAQEQLIDIFDLPQELRMLAYKEGFCKNEEHKLTLLSSKNNSKISKYGRLNISKNELIAVLEEHNWHQTETAKGLNISRVALWKKMKKFNLL